MGRLGRIDPDPGIGWRQQTGLQERCVVRVLQLGLLLLPGLQVLRAAQALAQHVGGIHAGALAVGGAEAGEGEPGLVPEEDEVALDREAFLHHPFDVVDHAVEGAVGQEQHPHPAELARGLECEELFLDLAQRHGAVHRVLVQGIALEIDDLSTRQDHAVVVRFVAVAVDQHDVARADQGLHHDLVAGRGAVGGEEGLLRAEGAGRQLLRFLDRPGGLEQAIQATRGRRGLGQEDVGAIKGAHVLDPVRARDRLAAADRHGVEDARGLARIFLQGGEEGGAVAGLNTAEDVQVQLHEVFLVVEDPAAEPEILAGDLLDRAVGDQVGIELRADLGDQPAQLGPVILGPERVDILVADAVEVAGEDRQIVGRFQRQAGADDDGLDVVVEKNADQRVLEARHHHRLVDEGVLGPAHGVDRGLHPALLLVGQPVDDEDLEIRLGQRAHLGREQRFILVLVVITVVAIQGDRPPSVGARGEGAGDPADREGHALDLAVLEQALEIVEGEQARERPIGLDRRQALENLADALGRPVGGPAVGLALQGLGGLAQGAPLVDAQLHCAVVFAHRAHR